MVVKSYPENFASALQPVVFDLSSVRLDASLGANIDIMKFGQIEPVGTKRFYRSSKVSINVAPYALACLNIRPLSADGVQQMPRRTVKLYLATDGEVSEERYLAAGRMTLPVEVLLSDRSVRRIAPGEVDEFSFIPPAGEVWVEFSVTNSAGDSYAWRQAPFVSDGGMVACAVDMRTIATKMAAEAGVEVRDIDKIKVVVYYGASMAFEVKYVVESATAEGVRLAWINRYGTVDCHTFPSRVGSQLQVKRRGETRVGDTVKFPLAEAWMEQTVSSGMQPWSVVQWLSDIAVSPKVWRWANGSWVECNIMDGQVTTHTVDEPGTVKLTLREVENIKTQTL